MSFDDKSQTYLEAEYALGRGYAASLRLNFQYAMLKDLIGYNIYPNIVTGGGIPQDAKIADVGTGTAQWLIDVNKELPAAQLEGFDISEEQYPCKTWLPDRISLQRLDITKPTPQHLEGRYDMVQVRLFLCVIQNEGPAPILRAILKMLKPGGWLQWVEYDPASFHVVSPDLNLKQSAFEKYIEVIRGPNGIAKTWPGELAPHLEAAGFQESKATNYAIPQLMYAPFMQIHLFAAEEVSLKAMKNDAPEAQGPLFRKLLTEVYEENKTGVSMAHDVVVAIGRKPL